VKSPAKLPQPSKKKENVGRIARKEGRRRGKGKRRVQVVWGDDILWGWVVASGRLLMSLAVVVVVVVGNLKAAGGAGEVGAETHELKGSPVFSILVKWL
jgi:hypothetical protein